ncbi:MAG: hypothetical protein WCA16_17645 [Candidatus Sulfotelmatobacter sp.]
MILGMTTYTYTLIHVVISLIGIGSGVVVLWGMSRSKRLNGITAIFLASTVLTSVSGFGFPNQHLTPGLKLGIISLVLLAIAIPARYLFHLAGGWRLTYVITAAMALYLNVFVLVVQLFEKSPTLRALAPTQSEPPFVATQLVVLVAFIGLTVLAGKKFRLEAPRYEQRRAA